MSNKRQQKPLTPDTSLADVCRGILAQQDGAASIRDKDFKPLFANAAYLDLFEISLEVWMLGHWSAHFGSSSADYVHDVVVPAVISGEKWKGELEIITHNGKSKQVLAELNGIRNQDGKLSYFYALYAEVTQLKTLEQELKEQNDFLNAIIDTLPDPIVVKDENHAWIAVNREFCRISGRSRGELLGKSDYDYFPKEEADVFWRQDDEAMRTGKIVANEETITGKSGETRLLSTKKTSVTLPDGRKILVGMGRDITNERHLERTIAQSYRQLESDLTALKRDLGKLTNSASSGVSRAEAIRGLISRSNKDFTEYIQESGSPLPPLETESDNLAHLSPREYQVFMLLAKGERVKEVARHLGVSSNTVSTYRARIMQKLGISSLTELIQVAMQYGLI